MKSYCFLLLLALMAGCRTPSQSQADLYQAYFASASDDYLMLRILDRGDIHIAQSRAVSNLAESLSHLRKLATTADSSDLERQKTLTSTILKYAITHQAELPENRFSLQMLTELKRTLTDDSDIRRATELIDYVIKNSTNQFEAFEL